MAYPRGRLALHRPDLGAVYVMAHDGGWDHIVGRDGPGKGWRKQTLAQAREHAQWAGCPVEAVDADPNPPQVGPGPGATVPRTAST